MSDSLTRSLFRGLLHAVCPGRVEVARWDGEEFHTEGEFPARWSWDLPAEGGYDPDAGDYLTAGGRCQIKGNTDVAGEYPARITFTLTGEDRYELDGIALEVAGKGRCLGFRGNRILVVAAPQEAKAKGSERSCR